MDRSLEIRFNRYRHFFTRHMKKYIEERFYTLQSDPKIFSVIKDITFHDCERWKTGPIEYLSPREALALGIHLGMGEDHPWLLDKYFDRIMDYFDWSINHSQCKKTQSLAHLALGVILFEKAVHSPREEQRNMLFLSRHYLDECLQTTFKSSSMEVIIVYQALVEVCLDNLPGALKHLAKASKVSEGPVPIWKILASVYKHLGQERVSEFYMNKITSFKIENNLGIAA
ncbi:MAG: hypothetical protein KC493_05780 [Bacteriovoracaceae bacterium]|nr:hypothetical protein [Bacteriovoracaceae bacterium]